MSELARCNGTVLVASGETIGVVEQAGGWIVTALFVSALVALLTAVGGVLVTIAVGAPGAILLGVAAVAAGLAWLFVRKRRQIKAAGLPAPWLVFDRAAGVVRTGQGEPLCSFADVRIERVFQVGSSSKALAVCCPRKIVIARGTPFGDEIDAVEQVLRRALAR